MRICVILQEKEHPKDEITPLGEMLHSAMVRAAVEEGLALHTLGNLNELMRTGVYKACSEEEAKQEREKTKVPCCHSTLDIL